LKPDSTARLLSSGFFDSVTAIPRPPPFVSPPPLPESSGLTGSRETTPRHQFVSLGLCVCRFAKHAWSIVGFALKKTVELTALVLLTALGLAYWYFSDRGRWTTELITPVSIGTSAKGR
jgi:hypothetical protein